jgi:hypothetical protein
MQKFNWIKSNKELWTANLLSKEVFCIRPINTRNYVCIIYKSPSKVKNPKRLYFDHKYQAKEFVEEYITERNYMKTKFGI